MSNSSALKLVSFLSCFIYPALRNLLIFIAILGLVEIFFATRIPFVNADIIDALAYTQWDSFKHQALLLIILFIGQLVVGICSKYSLLVFHAHLEKNVRNAIFRYALAQPAAFSEKYSTGDILSRMLNDTPKLKGFIVGIVLQFCFDALAIIF
jgi:ABC-type multidrug transport system fused ATPase/permease subunit